jgi:hypothetical protein
MNPIHHLRRLAGLLAALAGLAAALVAGATPAFASLPPEPGPGGHGGAPVPPPVIHTVVVTEGMPGWQIALIAAGAALLAATAAVLAYRAWTARRRPATATA